MLSEFQHELTNFYSPWNHQKTHSFVMISGELEVNQFAYYLLEAKISNGL